MAPSQDSFWLDYFRVGGLMEKDAQAAAALFAEVGVTQAELPFLTDARLARLGMTDEPLRHYVLLAIRAKAAAPSAPPVAVITKPAAPAEPMAAKTTERTPLVSAAPPAYSPSTKCLAHPHVEATTICPHCAQPLCDHCTFSGSICGFTHTIHACEHCCKSRARVRNGLLHLGWVLTVLLVGIIVIVTVF